jgi:hypothetical protein
MADTIRLDIPINESPVPAALDAFYDFVKALAPAGPGDRVGILGTLVEFDIHERARLYNDYVVRAFADRTVRTSPIASQGVGDLAERYSARYLDMLTLLVASLDTTIDAAAQNAILNQEETIKAVSKDRDTWLGELEDQWAEEAKRHGIDLTKIDTDPSTRERFLERRVFFLKQRRFAQTLQRHNDKLDYAELKIEAIRISSYPDDEARQLVDLLKQARRSKTIRPRRPDLELKKNWDEITIQNPEHESMPDIFDIGPLIESIVDPRTITKGSGSRGFSVKSTSNVTNSHDGDWNASGSASYMFFLRGDFSTNNASHFRSAISKVREVKINFEHVGMLDITRGTWFSSQIFGFKRVKDFLKRDTMLAQRLGLLANSLIVGRGLTVKLFFQDKSDVHEWGSTSTSGSGGVTILGINLGIGGGGGSSSSWETRRIDEQEQTVTFSDGPEVCRLLGVKVTPVMPGARFEDFALGARPLFTIPAFAQAAEVALQKGVIVEPPRLFGSVR